MSYIKSQEEIEKIKQGGKILGEILEKLGDMVKPGITAWDVDVEAERLIKEAGGRPAFKGYKGRKSDPPFPSTICASKNEELVHGIATKDKVLNDGDIFSIDIGMQWPTSAKATAGKPVGENGNGYYTDTAITVVVGEVPEKTKQLIAVTKKALEIGIEQCQVGNTVADIGKAIQSWVEPQGYGIVRDLVGHGVGHSVHEDPRVPNYYDKNLESYVLQEGVVIAIEPMITIGDYHVKTADDGWSISTVDGKLCSHQEHTIVITKTGPMVVTRRPQELK